MGNVYKYHRHSLRLKHYDYSRAGYYFVTICAQGREHLFGEIVEGKMVLNVAGEMINQLWYEIEDDFQNVYLHEFVIMPNHIHGIIEIVDAVGVPLVGTQKLIHNDNKSKTVGVPLVGTLKCAKQPKGNHEGLQPKGNHEGLPLRGNDTSNIMSRAPMKGAPTVGDIVGAFKSKITNAYIKMVKNGTCPPFNKRIWQRNYHEHVVRNDADYERVATYTINNPLTWDDDMFAKP
jgi:REP element-mobilizing transposase RayT